jgi:thiamine pyrophosphate-dependent acetolactate synthase large subunit-like protein
VGFRVERPEELGPAMREALASGRPSVVTVAIDPQAGRKPQQFHWNTRLEQEPAGAAR